MDAIAIEYMEVGGSCGGPGPWPHLSALSPGIVTRDRRPNGQFVRVVRYISEGVTDCAGVRVQDAGTIAHELGHTLGLPDDYQSFGGTGYQYRRWNVGCWELMGGGSWGCGTGPKLTGYGPTHMGPLHQATLLVNGEDVTASLKVDESARTLTGMVDGLRLGENTLFADSNGRGNGRPTAELTVVNHPVTGPITGAEPAHCDSRWIRPGSGSRWKCSRPWTMMPPPTQSMAAVPITLSASSSGGMALTSIRPTRRTPAGRRWAR